MNNMLKPTKYTDLDVSILNVATTILSILRVQHAISIVELNDVVSNRMNDAAVFNFTNALNVLYIIGAIDYVETADAIFLTQRPERKP